MLPLTQLVPNTYIISVALYINNFKVYDIVRDCVSFTIVDTKGLAITANGDTENGILMSSWIKQ